MGVGGGGARSQHAVYRPRRCGARKGAGVGERKLVVAFGRTAGAMGTYRAVCKPNHRYTATTRHHPPTTVPC